MTEEQNASAELRERFLNFSEKFEGNNVVAQLYAKNVMHVKFLALQGGGNHYAVEGLKTPTGVMDHAVLRTCDTMFISMPFEAPSESK
uniref:NTF2 domain-containing protein n=1 Tax=Panagrellus redivivus TaxID=6233 RepID=A0A7E4UW29_PANRE